MAGQQAENLLDFDADEPTPASDGLGGLGSISNNDQVISQSQIATAAKSVNPLDELMDLFSTASMQAPAQPAGQPQIGFTPSGSVQSTGSVGSTGLGGLGGGGGFGGLDDLMSPSSTGSNGFGAAPSRPQQQQQQQQAKPVQQPAGQEDDLLGLF